MLEDAFDILERTKILNASHKGAGVLSTKADEFNFEAEAMSSLRVFASAKAQETRDTAAQYHYGQVLCIPV